MKYILWLQTWDQVRAMADPLRVRILDCLRDRPMTTKQVALLLRENPTKLYHHVELLEAAGVVRLVETRPNRGTIEKYYEAVAREFIVDRRLLESRSARRATRGYEALFLGALRATLQEAEISFSKNLVRPVSQGRNALMFRQQFSGTEEEMSELLTRVRKVIEQFQAVALRKKVSSHSRYALSIAFYPTAIGTAAKRIRNRRQTQTATSRQITTERQRQ